MEVFHKRHKEQEADYRHKVHQGKETLKKTSQVRRPSFERPAGRPVYLRSVGPFLFLPAVFFCPSVSRPVSRPCRSTVLIGVPSPGVSGFAKIINVPPPGTYFDFSPG